MLVVMSGPSGAGKTTLKERLLESAPWLEYSVSATTRRPRPGEKDGRDYFFVTKEEFARAARAGGFLERAVVHGNSYGTPRKFIDGMLARGKKVLLDVDVKGAGNVRRLYGKKCVLIFVLPPSWGILEKRLRTRGKDDRKTIALRLKNARREFFYIADYDYFIINDDAKAAAERILKIIKEHGKIK